MRTVSRTVSPVRFTDSHVAPVASQSLLQSWPSDDLWGSPSVCLWICFRGPTRCAFAGMQRFSNGS